MKYLPETIHKLAFSHSTLVEVISDKVTNANTGDKCLVVSPLLVSFHSNAGFFMKNLANQDFYLILFQLNPQFIQDAESLEMWWIFADFFGDYFFIHENEYLYEDRLSLLNPVDDD
jgi:hypothetical protein